MQRSELQQAASTEKRGACDKCIPRAAPPSLTQETSRHLSYEWEFLFMLFPKIKVITSLEELVIKQHRETE